MRFELIPFGSVARPGAVACDGLVPGAALDLSHWSGNHTPPHLKRDTSVEIALAFAESGEARDLEVVTNNHFDSDGVLACWTVLRPELARAHAGLITAAAEAGDFDEWPSDERGLWLDAAITTLAAGGSDAASYAAVLPELDRIVPSLAAREELWGQAYRALLAAEALLEQGDITVERVGRIALVSHARGVDELPGPWISRLALGAERLLLSFAEGPGEHRFRYERPRWAWADTVRRPRLPAPRRGPIRRGLGEAWVIKGRRGMTGVAYTAGAIRADPSAIAARLAELDPPPVPPAP